MKQRSIRKYDQAMSNKGTDRNANRRITEAFIGKTPQTARYYCVLSDEMTRGGREVLFAR